MKPQVKDLNLVRIELTSALRIFCPNYMECLFVVDWYILDVY